MYKREDTNLISVDLTPSDAELFKFFQKDYELFEFFQENYENIKKLHDTGIFTVKARTVNLHIDQKGLIKGVDIVIRCV